jgi:TonB-linked SusC/RagA family outer membrane protein
MNHIKLTYLSLFILLIGLTLNSYAQKVQSAPTSGAQTIPILGTVVDREQKPLAGVSVQRQSSASKAITGTDGKFSVEADAIDYLIISKAGFNTETIPASAITSAPIVLSVAMIGAGEKDIVNIPGDDRKKRQLNSAVSVLKRNQLSEVPFSSLNNILIGKMPGVYVTQSATSPGFDLANILIRGKSSYNDAQSPLILVDGIERDFSDMDLSEIENITVLKDAASLSWYGIRGANGIIAVTTRSGQVGKSKVTFSAFAGTQIAQDVTKPLNSYTYASLYNEALKNDGFAPLYDANTLAAYQNKTNPTLYPDNNFVRDFLKSAAPVQRYTATVSGGNAAVRYFTSFSYYNQEGLFAQAQTKDYSSNAGYKRYNFRSNIEAAVTSKLDLSMKVGGRIENRLEPTQDINYLGTTNVLNALYLTPPNAFPLLNTNGSYGGTSVFQTSNPLALLQGRGYNSQLTRVLQASMNLKYNLDGITKGLTVNAMYSYDMSGLYVSGQTQNFEVYQFNAPSNAYTRYGTQSALAFRAAAFNNSIRNNEFLAGFDYKRDFGVHDVGLSLKYNNGALFNPVPNARFDYVRKAVSSRATYAYKQKYFADITVNYSGNDRFTPGNRYGLFPALSLGWVATEESFLKDVTPLNYLKLRGSYGLTGSDNLFGARLYAWQALYTTAGMSSYNFGTGFSNSGGATGEVALPNSQLTFEKSRKLNIGFDSKLLDQALDLTFDYFVDTRTDIISPAFVPSIIGQMLVPENNGEAQYKGFETGVNYTKTFDKFTWSLFGTFTSVKSDLSKYNDRPGLPANQLQAGHPLGNFGLLYEAIGVFKDQAEINAAPRQTLSGKVQPGDIRYKDVNNDGLIDNYDRSILNYSMVPTSYYSFGAKIKFGGFDLSGLFVGQSGGLVDISSIVGAGNANNGFLNQYSVNRWTPATASSSLWPRLGITDRGNNTAASTFWIRSSNYLQLNNVELGYSLPSSITRKLKMSECRVYVNGYNLTSFSKLNDSDVNPALITAGRNGNYPYIKTFSLGINVSFF